MKKNKGFTLVELMVVIVIIGILAALAIPKFMGATNKTKATEFKPILKQIYTLQEAYKQEHDTYGKLTEIGFDKPSTSARFTYQEPTAGTAPAIAAAGATSSLALAKVAAGAVIKGIDAATGKDVAIVAGTDDACVNDQGGVLAQSDLLSSLASLSKTSAIATCAP